MDELSFAGAVINGRGGHKHLFVPGCDILKDADADWPEKLFPGSLNVLVATYPTEFRKRGIAPSTQSLDTMGFLPTFTINANLMGNNKLQPSPTMPLRGTAQVWRATLRANGADALCWVLRRFGSGLAQELELVAGGGLRGILGLDVTRNWPATVTMRGQWRR